MLQEMQSKFSFTTSSIIVLEFEMPDGYLGISTNPTINMLGHMMHEVQHKRDEESNERKPKYLFDVHRDTQKALSNLSRKSKQKSIRHSEHYLK